MNCPTIDLSSQEMDRSGFYVRIKVDFATRRIGLQVLDNEHRDIAVFWGYQCQDIYHALLNHENAGSWFTDLTHIAYIGKELKKAEIALSTGGGYYQE